MSLPIAAAAEKLDISLDTLRRWDKLGIIKATRDSRGIRHFDESEVKRLIAKRSKRESGDNSRNYVIHSEDAVKPYQVIGLFAGAGGTALGFHHAGFSHLLLSEIDKHAAATLKTNQPDWNVVQGDVAEIDFAGYLGSVDVIEGGFPCQAFSYAGHSRGFEDTRGTLFFEFARAIQEAAPKVFVGENVKGLLRHDAGRTLETMMNTLRSIVTPDGHRYRVAYRVVRAQYHDVPQKRERLIIMGVREDVGSEIYFPREKDYIVSLWDAIGDAPASEGQKYPQRKREIMDLIPPGGYWKDLPDELQREYLGGSYHLSGGKTGMARRLSWDEPALTLTCAPAQKQTERCHPAETRPLNVREYARIQTFPDSWKFEGGTGNAYKQIGNAVPVNLAYYVAKCVEVMLNASTLESNSEFVVPAKPEEYVN